LKNTPVHEVSGVALYDEDAARAIRGGTPSTAELGGRPAIEAFVLTGSHGMRRNDERRSRGRVLGIHDLDLVMLSELSCLG